MTAHTPGPWRTHPVDATSVVSGEPTRFLSIAQTQGDYDNDDEWPVMEANARLIAAAPELLEALTICANLLRTQCACLPSSGCAAAEARAKAETAIAKATGAA